MTNDQVNEKLTLILNDAHARYSRVVKNTNTQIDELEPYNDSKGLSDRIRQLKAYAKGVLNAQLILTEIIFEAMEEINETK